MFSFHAFVTGRTCIAETTASASGVLNITGCVISGILGRGWWVGGVAAANSIKGAAASPLMPA